MPIRINEKGSKVVCHRFCQQHDRFNKPNLSKDEDIGSHATVKLLHSKECTDAAEPALDFIRHEQHACLVA